jgi:predicted DNA-binding transcriptional regulator AlpA
MTAPDEMLTVNETAALTKESVDTLLTWRLAGGGPRSFWLAGRVRYLRSDVQAWLDRKVGAA